MHDNEIEGLMNVGRRSTMAAATGAEQEALARLTNNHVFPRPCPDPSNNELRDAVERLMRGDFVGHLRTIVNACHGDAVAAGWHHDIKTGQPKDRNVGEMLMLAVSEIAEGMEGHRKNRTDDKLPHRTMLEVELADFIIRCGDTMARPEFVGYAEQCAILSAHPRELTPDCIIYMRDASQNVGEHLLHVVRAIIVAASHVGAESFYAGRALMGGMLMAARIARVLQLDLPGAVVEKRDYNRTRQDHSVAARLADDGKRY